MCATFEVDDRIEVSRNSKTLGAVWPKSVQNRPLDCTSSCRGLGDDWGKNLVQSGLKVYRIVLRLRAKLQ